MTPDSIPLPGWPRIALLAAVALALTACAGSRAWWQDDLEAWRGASASELVDAWGPPVRTLTDADDTTVLVYESSRELDYRMETLAEPARMLDPDRLRTARMPGGGGECTLFFELRDGRVAAVRHEGAACDIVPRDRAQRRAP
ncbi:hypothetical protein [Wenzhouxiangella sp. XN24]|uniref:hypothetical protein n=1 Tax=Wenzhouxiangella sp. XN24 TaxID=2713569 RepID=UPI0013EDF6CB|nr:hypothetical protein [Wenzhouxiangella sp. XN24]NGX17239.1 hypothetical protein [Wenzhouxiangella sp. XN24]